MADHDEYQSNRGWLTEPELWFKQKARAQELRREQTPAEDLLWEQLEKKKLGVKFRRQFMIEQYMVDFYCHAKRLVIEVDGSIHDEQKLEDAIRQARLEELGFRVVRFTNQEVYEHIPKVICSIQDTLQLEPFPKPPKD